jgi:integrase
MPRSESPGGDGSNPATTREVELWTPGGAGRAPADRDQIIRDAVAAGTSVVELSERYGISVGRVVSIAAGPAREPVVATVVVRPDRVPTQAEIDRTVLHADEVLATMAQAMAPNTVLAYRQQWQRYLRWCRAHKRTPVPASLETLLSYIGSMQHDGLAPASIRIAMAALRKVHRYGNPPPGWIGSDSEEITDLLVGYEKRVGRDPDRQPRRAAAARKAIMRALLDTCDETPRGIRDRAALLLTYYMAARRSEVCNLRTPSDLRYTEEGLEAHVAFSKTDQTGADAKWVPIPQNTAHAEYDPVRAVEAWLRIRGDAPGPLLLPVDKHGNIRPSTVALSGSSMEGVWERAVTEARSRALADSSEVGQVLQRLLKVRLTPHSGRKGFASDARVAGWDLLDITRHGRWSAQSKVVHIYIEEIDKWLRHQVKPVQL